MREIVFRITGMSCAACSAAVEKALARVEGVSSAGVNLPAERATVVFDERVCSEEALVDAVKKVGFGAEPEEAGVKITLKINGMSCAACSAAVEKALTRTEGVLEAAVSLPQNRAVVRYNPRRTSPAKLAEAVKKAGFSVPKDGALDDGKRRAKGQK